MSINNSNTNNSIQSLDISLKKIPFLSINSNLSVNALYKILIKNPRLVNMIDEKKETFLSYAIKRNNNPIIDLILTSPLLDLAYKDKNGNTYLHLSVIQQNVKIIQTLIEKGISLDEKNNDGNTALHFAYYINNNDIVKLLIKCNINTNIKNNRGLIAEEIIPTYDIDKIAGYEVDMNFDINIYDELKYDNNENNENYDLKSEYNINNKRNIDSSGSGETKYNSQISKKKNFKNNKKKVKKLKQTKKKNKNNDNDKLENSEEDDNDIINLPFYSIGNSNRKISNIDRIYYENDRFIRKESENYPFYSELIDSINQSRTSSKNNNNNLSNISEKNNNSESNSNNENNKYIIDSKKICNNASLLKNSININDDNNKNIINFTNKPLLDFLMQINMQKYYLHFNNNGLEYIAIIIEDAKKGVFLTDELLKTIGINKPGDRAKILIRIKEKANLFEFDVPKSVYYIANNLEKIEDDPNVYKLYEWLKNISLEQYLKTFLVNGYCSIDLLFMQKISNNNLTDDILKNELGIELLGHRTRIFNKLKQEYKSYENKLKSSVITFNTNENSKICSECFIF